MKYKWFDKQDRAYLEGICCDYTNDVIELIRDYIFLDRRNKLDIQVNDNEN